MWAVVNEPGGTGWTVRLPPALGVQHGGQDRLGAGAPTWSRERARGGYNSSELPWEFRPHALFVAFAPYRCAALRRRRGGRAWRRGRRAAAPIARDIMVGGVDARSGGAGGGARSRGAGRDGGTRRRPRRAARRGGPRGGRPPARGHGARSGGGGGHDMSDRRLLRSRPFDHRQAVADQLGVRAAAVRAGRRSATPRSTAPPAARRSPMPSARRCASPPASC